MPASETAPKTRRPKARQSTIVIAAMEERVSMLDGNNPSSTADHRNRIVELLDELKRSLGKDTDGE